MNTETRIVEPGRMETPLGAIRFLFLPPRDLFAQRAERLRTLSKGHPLGDYLAFLAVLAEAQQDALNNFPAAALPGPDEQALCREHGMPVLSSRSWRRDPAWLWGLQMILQEMQEAALPAAAHRTIAGLMQATEAGLEETADGVLSEDPVDCSPQEMPFVAAALQVYWVHMASSLREDAFGRLDQGGLCPVCGSHPSVGIVRGNGPDQGLRYLCCSLCASQWHLVRITCSNCESTERISYSTLEGSNGAVKAESCDNCDSYLKLLYPGKDSRMEATADDLASLALDLLMEREGKARGGPNLFFHPGTRTDDSVNMNLLLTA